MSVDKQELSSILKKVSKLVGKVGQEVMTRQPQVKITIKKRYFDFSTDQDIFSEKKLVKGLKEIKDVSIYSEEANIKPKSTLFWVVDPIDGTKNYYSGLPLWAINVALYDSLKKVILLGVVYFPCLDRLFSAYKDGGATCNDKKLRPSLVKSLKEATLLAELPTPDNKFKSLDGFLKLYLKFYRVRSWGIASSICYVASGAVDAYLDLSGTTKSFDIFAPIIIAQEAGCVVNNFQPDISWKGWLSIAGPNLKFAPSGFDLPPS